MRLNPIKNSQGTKQFASGEEIEGIEGMATPIYPKCDFRRVLTVLAAVDELGASATSITVARRCGMDDHSVARLIKHAQEQIGVVIEKNGSVLRIVDWGPVVSQDGARLALLGLLPGHP